LIDGKKKRGVHMSAHQITNQRNGLIFWKFRTSQPDALDESNAKFNLYQQRT
jgi:hypothetical protein